jgi:hypothetical protein
MTAMLHEAIKSAVLAAVRGLHIGMPGKIEAYDHESGRARVKPLIQEPNQQGQPQAIKPISGVPVIMPGGETACLYMPPKVGDTGWISFSHRSLELWLSRGGDQPPGDPRVMDLSDAVFFPGLRSFAQGSLGEDEGALVLKNGRAKVKIKNDKIAIGTQQAELLSLLSQLLVVLQTGANAGGPVVFTPAAGPGSIPDIAIKLSTIAGTL